MTGPITQILTPSNITIILSGTKQYNSSSSYQLYFPVYNDFTNNISLAGSNTSGEYIGNIANNGTPSTNLVMRGSGGGILSGLPDVLYINMKGSIEVIVKDIDTGTFQSESDILVFTGLIQITITGINAELNLVNSYAEIQNQTLGKILFSNIDISSAPVSITYANCTRYICIGDIILNFQL